MFSDTTSDILSWCISLTTSLQWKVMVFWAGRFLNWRFQVHVIKTSLEELLSVPTHVVCVSPCTSSSRVLYPGCRLGYVSGNPEHEDMSSGSTSYRQKWENLHHVLIFLHIQEPQPISTSKSDQQREKWSGLFVKKDAGICGCSYASRINFMTGTDLAVSILISRF